MYGGTDLNPSQAGEVEGYIRSERVLETLRISRSDSGSRQARVELEYILIALQTKMSGRTLFRTVGLVLPPECAIARGHRVDAPCKRGF